jgi:hypothetical protein
MKVREKTIGQLDSDTLENYFGLDKLLDATKDKVVAV